MKTIFRSAFALLLAFTSVSVFAENRMDMGVLAGYRINDASSDTTGVSIDGKGSLQLGGLAFLPLSEMFSLRTGFIYTTRNFDATVDGPPEVTTSAKFSYFDIPVTFMYNIGEMGGIFFGPGLSLKVTDDCDGSCKGVKSTLVPLQFGGHFKIAPQFSAEVYYETAPGKVADGIKDPTAVVINGVFTFE